MSKFEWNVNQHRDTYASYVGHYDMLSYFAVAQNDSVGRVRYQMLEVSWNSVLVLTYSVDVYPFPFSSVHQKMVQPCGVPPPRNDDEQEENRTS